MKLRSIVVDDEEAARDLIKEIVAPRPDVEVIGSYADSRQALVGIRRDNPDLLFLDIQMPGRDGFAILDELGAEAPPVIFVTAFEEYAVQAFDVCAIDYILKPLDEERVHRAVDRALARRRDGTQAPEPGAVTEMIREMRRQRNEYLKYLPVKKKDKVILQRVEDVSWFEAEGKYVRLHSGGENHLIRHSMHSLESKLDPAKFVRVSRSSIVNIDHISHFEPWSHGEWAVLLRTGQRVISTHGYREGLQRLLRAR